MSSDQMILPKMTPKLGFFRGMNVYNNVFKNKLTHGVNIVW